MSSRPVAKRQATEQIDAQRQEQARGIRKRGITLATVTIAVAAVVIGILYGVYRSASTPAPAAASGTSQQYPYQVGEPGPAKKAPDFTLASSTGGTMSLRDLRGKTVLLYFQEGIDCQPCFDQIADLERNQAKLKSAGIDAVVSITSDPVDALALKSTDMKLSTPVLSDPNLAVIKAYDANSYGMMGNSRAGHSFLLVGPDGVINKRADYGGAPKYIMFVPTAQVLADVAGATK
jgi:peroxiredoxin Q/BCP